MRVRANARRVISLTGIALILAGILPVPESTMPASARQSLTQQSFQCSGSNDTDVPITDGGAVASAITISGCAGNAVAGSTVEVHIAHSFIGDLMVDLIAPDASVSSLHWRTGGDGNNIDQTYAVNLASEIANGSWKLRVQDMAMGDNGFVDSWTLNLVGGGIAGDFSIAASPASGSAAAGGSITTAVSTALINGGSQTINLSASGLPTGATATIAPSSVTLGNSSTLTISMTSATARGAYFVTITGTGESSIIRATTYKLTVNPTAVNCSGTNGTDVAIPDTGTTVHSPITIVGCAGRASAVSAVEVHLAHTHIDDLIVNLVAPDGSVYTLHQRTGADTANINHTYTVNLAGEIANGIWKLRVRDADSGDTGLLDTWTLNLAGTGQQPGNCVGVNGLAAIPVT